MAHVLSKRDLRTLLDSLVEQGCRIRPKRHGGQTVVYLPDGASIITIHDTPGDRRVLANYRATVQRAGLRWPLGHG